MNLGLALRRFRSGMAIVMMLVVGVASFTVVMHRAALASPVYASSANVLSNAPASPVKPCNKIVPPGVVNTCPLSSFSIAAVLSSDAGYASNTPIAATAWSLNDSSLPVQVAGLGLYRPPRFDA